MLRVGICRPVGVQRLSQPHAHFTGVYYTNGVGVISVCFFYKGFLRPKARTNRGKMPRFFMYLSELFITNRPPPGHRGD